MSISYAKGAALVCRQAVFRDFVTTKGYRAETDAEAACVMRDYCGVKSRAEFDSDPSARDRYLAMLNEMNAWLAGNYRG